MYWVEGLSLLIILGWAVNQYQIRKARKERERMRRRVFRDTN